MQCTQHVDQGAVGTCNSCGRGLCPECISVFQPPLCPTCALAHNQGVERQLKRQLAWMGALFVIALILLMGHMTAPSAIGGALMVAFFPAGWRFLGKFFSPDGNYLHPLARWMNLGFQAGLALMLGVVLGPIQLFKAWKEMQIVRATQRNLGASDK